MNSFRSKPSALATVATVATLALASLGSGCDLADSGGSAPFADGEAARALPAVVAAAVPGPALLGRTAPPISAELCATPAVAAWTGTANLREEGAGSSAALAAQVTWRWTSTADCVDRYAPTGDVTWDFAIGCCCALRYEPGAHAIAAADGELIVDRSVSPPVYLVRGETRWETQESCSTGPDDDTPPAAGSGGGTWIDQSGTVGDDGIVGATEDGAFHATWSFAPAP